MCISLLCADHYHGPDAVPVPEFHIHHLMLLASSDQPHAVPRIPILWMTTPAVRRGPLTHPESQKSTTARAWCQMLPQMTSSFDSQCGALPFNLAALDPVWHWRPCHCGGAGGRGEIPTNQKPPSASAASSEKPYADIPSHPSRMPHCTAPCAARPSHLVRRLAWCPLPGQTTGFIRAELTPPSPGHLPLGSGTEPAT